MPSAIDTRATVMPAPRPWGTSATRGQIRGRVYGDRVVAVMLRISCRSPDARPLASSEQSADALAELRDAQDQEQDAHHCGVVLLQPLAQLIEPGFDLLAGEQVAEHRYQDRTGGQHGEDDQGNDSRSGRHP